MTAEGEHVLRSSHEKTAIVFLKLFNLTLEVTQ
jgi:hypothetical protein